MVLKSDLTSFKVAQTECFHEVLPVDQLQFVVNDKCTNLIVEVNGEKVGISLPFSTRARDEEFYFCCKFLC